MEKKFECKTAYLRAFFFAAILFAGLILYLVLPQHDFSQKENRTLQTRPAVTLSGLADGSFMEKFETYTTEQLPFRTFFVDIKAGLSRLTLSRENNGIVLGKDGYLFEKTYGESAQLSKNEAAILHFIENAGRPVTVAIAPNATEVLKDKVPKGMPTVDQKAVIDAFYRRIDGLPEGKSVDVLSVLDANREKQLYYRTDHHWTTEAAYLAYGEIVAALEEQAGSQGGGTGTALPETVSLESLTKHEARDFYGTHYAKFQAPSLQPDTLTWYDVPVNSFERSDGTYDTLYDLEKLQVYDKYAMFLRGNDELCVIRSDHAGNGRHLIVFKDSYANCLIPFLTYQYDIITVVDLRYFAKSVSGLLTEDENADILLLYNFSFLNEDNHFYRLTS